MTDERRVEVAAEALLAGWRIGAGLVSQAMARDAAYRDARAVVAALDAHDGDLRERLAAAIEHADWSGIVPGTQRAHAARIVREWR